MAGKGKKDGEDPRPVVVSLCGTFLKREMQSIYRQVANLSDFRNVVFTEVEQNREIFPFDPVITMTKLRRRKPRGNFILRFWYKHIVKQWPPPRKITKERGPYYPYNLPALLTEHAPDVAHVYYGHKAVKYLEMLEAWGGPFVVSFHGVDVVKFIDEEGYREQLKQVFAKASLVLARSDSLLVRLEELGCPKEKLRINRTPIPLEDFPFAERTAPVDGKWRLVQACRLIPKKGLLTTLDALSKIVDQLPDLEFRICGTGPIEDELRAAIGRLGLEKNVTLVGWVDQEALKKEYAEAHAFLHPSELTDTSDQEGVPNSMLEAMASGLPVIGTLHGGIPEAVTDGHDGYLVPEKSPKELSQAILRLTAEPQRLPTLSQAASESVREKFGFKEQIAALEACYHEAVEIAAGEKSEPSA